MTRATLDGKNPGGWYPEQKISLAETIEAYTMGSAYAEFAEKEKRLARRWKVGGHRGAGFGFVCAGAGENQRRKSGEHGCRRQGRAS